MLEQIVKTYRETGFLHHAYLLVGDAMIIRSVLADTLAAVESKVIPTWENYETFGIDESRGLIARSARRDWRGGREFVVLTARRYSAEAQNALLKLFEEPRSGLHFFLISDQVTNFLPTLQSRFLIVEHRDQIGGESGKEVEKRKAKEFLAATPAKRLDLIATELKKEPAREAWLPFLNALEVVCHETKPLNQTALTEIMMARNYLTDPASLPRLLFEHLALVLPRVP
ncbi:MAG: hypothetical protein AAB415_01475 [Patescibacteria group bacterium]